MHDTLRIAARGVMRLDGAPMFKTEVFREQMLEKILVTLLGLFGAPIVTRRQGNCAPLVTPLIAASSLEPNSTTIMQQKNQFHVTLQTCF